jgi:hypothetical protein
LADLRIQVDIDRVTVDDLIGIEDGKIRAVRDMLARLAVDEQGQPLPLDEAKRLVGSLSLRQLKQQSDAMMRALKDGAIPPASASN